jgi:hypothetical protein
MKDRRQQAMRDLRKDLELDRVVQERFKMERRPEASVDGDNPWERDLFEDEPVDAWQIIDSEGA